ncbi:MAG TPA: Sec-independent protein translocase protein TatB [Polyangiaceae bacterium]
MSFGELTVVIIVALVIFGPKELPKILRKLGQWSGKMRRMAADFRTQSGIDEALRSEGLDLDIREIRKLARGELTGVMSAARVGAVAAAATPAANAPPANAVQEYGPPVFSEMFIERDRENPREGADSYGALPDTAIVYDGSLPKSALADDPLYMLGDAAAKFPEPKPEQAETSAAEPAEPPAQ